jgi:hypothetical protein
LEFVAAICASQLRASPEWCRKLDGRSAFSAGWLQRHFVELHSVHMLVAGQGSRTKPVDVPGPILVHIYE